MQQHYRIIGSELSPYSVKVRSYCRYKGISHEWLSRGTHQALFERHAKLPLIPLIISADDESLQDSTPIIEWLESKYPHPPIHPEDSRSRFVSQLLEEFADEWGNKWVFHLRWAREVDQLSAASRIVESLAPEADASQREAMIPGIIKRMTGRVWFVGSSPLTASQIEDSFTEVLTLLDAHLAERPYVFGDRPALGDLGLWGELYSASTDPTAGEIIRSRYPQVSDWIQRLLEPQQPAANTRFEPWDSLVPSLLPLITGPVAGQFLPWTQANAAALETGTDEFSVMLRGQEWHQKPIKYHARSYQALRDKYAEVDATTRDLMRETGCHQFLAQ